MTSAAIYARVSSARQKEQETIVSQTEALRAHAGQLGLDVPQEWVFEDDGHSGASLVRPALDALRDLVAQVPVDVVLCHSPDRLARKYAYQALLIEELARAGTSVVFVKAPSGDTPEDALLVQFQGMIAEYERAQIMERTRRGKNQRARSGSVNVLSGAPFGYRYVRKGDHAAARYEVVPHEAAIVAGLFRRYADEGVAIAELARWLGSTGVTTRTGKARWDRSTIWGMLRNPAYAGRACFGKTGRLGQQAGRNRVTRLAPVPAPGPSRLLGLRIRLLPRPHHHQRRQQDLLLPVHRQRQLPVRARQGLRQQAGPRRLPRPGRLGPHHRPDRRPVPDPRRDRRAPSPDPHRRPGHRPAQAPGRRPRQNRRRDHQADRRLPGRPRLP
jgi:DNA invertase Pin-like site-specific DNA recombinase